MNAEQQGNQHNDLGKGHQDAGNENDSGNRRIARGCQRDDTREDGIFQARTVGVNNGYRHQVGRDQQNHCCNQSGPGFLQTIWLTMAHRNMAACAAAAFVRITGKMARQTDMQRRRRTFRLFLRVITLPQLLQIDMDQRQDTEQSERQVCNQALPA